MPGFFNFYKYYTMILLNGRKRELVFERTDELNDQKLYFYYAALISKLLKLETDIVLKYMRAI